MPQLVRRERQLDLHLIHFTLELELSLEHALSAEIGAFLCKEKRTLPSFSLLPSLWN